ncbi:MAG TPA: DUF6084 family protein [Rhodothermales bacterium]|nr:DUF6084 family protein [Rhodothermales bacterium]
MPELGFQVTDVQPAHHGATPLLHFMLEIANTPPGQTIHSAMLQAQIQIQSVRRSYNEREKAKLVDLFGTPERWGQTLRNRLWTHAHVAVPGFTGSTQVALPVTCTYDLNVAATKYFYALEDGNIPLLFLFSGTIFYKAPSGMLQVQQVSWNSECAYDMPAAVWQDMMDAHYPNSAWLYLRREVFDRLYAYKSQHSLPSWEAALDRLLSKEEATPVDAFPSNGEVRS